MKAFMVGLLVALLFPYAPLAEERAPQETGVSSLAHIDAVTVYHRFDYEDADQPFRIKGPLLVERRNIEALLETLAKDRDVIVEVCPLKVLPGFAFGFYTEREERKRFCRIVQVSTPEVQTGESR